MIESAWVLVLILGMRHGVDPTHIALVNGFARFRPNLWNGVLLALGHSLMLTLLAVGIGTIVIIPIASWKPWILLLIGAWNLWQLLYPKPIPVPAFANVSPFIIGILLAAELETASQISVLALTHHSRVVVLGVCFFIGMLTTTGVDGYLAARTQHQLLRNRQANVASRILGWLVVIYAFGLGTAALCHLDLEPVTLPLGLSFFIGLILLRFWSIVPFKPISKSRLQMKRCQKEI